MVPPLFLHFCATSYPPIPEPRTPLIFTVLSIMKYLVIFIITILKTKYEGENLLEMPSPKDNH